MNILDQLIEPNHTKTLSVFELTTQLRKLLEGTFVSIHVQGEISNFKKHSSGHWYFTLKDDRAQIRAACFRNSNLRIRFQPEDGLNVYVRGRISVYEPRGDYQLIVDSIEPVGVGALQLAFEQLKAKLESEGLFDPSQKLLIPTLPENIGIITSPTGAAVKDILRVLHTRNDTVNIVIYPAAVEGESAASEIITGIKYFNEKYKEEHKTKVDVLIIGRGGGSAESLSAFNNEALARTIFFSNIPIISAVGHEIDFTIADFVADLRAPTPSAAAEMVSLSKDEIIAKIHRFEGILSHLIKYTLLDKKTQLQKLSSSDVFSNLVSRLLNSQQKLDEIKYKLEQSISIYLTRLNQNMKQTLGKLFALSPLGVLERGYALALSVEGKTIHSIEDISLSEKMEVQLKDGKILCEVKQLSKFFKK